MVPPEIGLRIRVLGQNLVDEVQDLPAVLAVIIPQDDPFVDF